MLRVGLVGLGYMGRIHFSCFRRLEEEGFPVRLTAVCDIEPGKLEGRDAVTGNISGNDIVDLSARAHYLGYEEMMRKEELDIVDIALPTLLHAQTAVAAMESGRHVLCEKPMAWTVEQCEEMVAASRRTGKTLMTAHCLRFWPAYEYLKECVDTGRFGDVVSAYFFRGGATPNWAWQNWILRRELSGGCLLDQHVHDVDMVQWLFGTPDAVTTSAVNVVPGSGYDAVSTRYLYGQRKVVCAEDDWTINGGFGFDMIYRVNFRRGNVHFSRGKVMAYPEEGNGFEPVLPADDGYYREIRYFCDCILNGKPPQRCMPESTLETIKITLAEQQSAQKDGMPVRLR